MSKSDLVKIRNGKAKVYLHSGQSEAMDSVKRMIFIIAGTQSGKTSFCLGLGG